MEKPDEKISEPLPPIDDLFTLLKAIDGKAFSSYRRLHDNRILGGQAVEMFAQELNGIVASLQEEVCQAGLL